VVIQDKDFLGYCNLIIRDNNGKQVYLESIEVKDGLNLFVVNKSLVSGIYFLEIINSDGQKTTSKHVVK
jgi:hypothetical protein